MQKMFEMAKKKTHEEFVSDLYAKNPNIDILGIYKSSSKEIECRCKVCGRIWNPIAGNLLNGQGCPVCGRKRARSKITKTHEQFVSDIAKRNPTVTILGEYVNVNTGILCECKICKHRWSPKPNSLMNGIACPECCHTGTSFEEQFILRAFQIALGDQAVKSRDRKTIGKELDIYIPSLNIAIEPGSWFWHKDKVKKDKEKIQICYENGIHLIVIYDTCNGKCKIEDAHIWKYDENLSTEANRHLLVDIVETLLQEHHINYKFSLNEISELTNYAYFNSRRKTTEEFIEELSKITDTIEILGEYKGSKTSVKCRCKTCNNVWNATPNSLLRGSGCKKCGYIENGKKRIKSHVQFVSELSRINGNIEVLGHYTFAKETIECRCKLCGRIWYPHAYDLLQGKGCSVCRKKDAGRRAAKTHEEFMNELSLANPDIEVLGEYVSRKEPIKCRCRKCGYIWSPSPDNVLHGHGCQRCEGKERYTLDSFKEKLETINPNIEVYGEYVNNRTNIKCKCRLCSYEWSPTPGSLLAGQGCPLCAGKLQYDPKSFALKMAMIDETIELLSEYSGRDKRVLCRCKICGFEWNPVAKGLLIGRGCPKKKQHDKFN